MSPRSPFRRTWLRYMPVMPTRASAAISTFSALRTTTSVVVTEVASRCGWPMLTPMKIAPAATAAAPAPRVSVVGVMVMSGSSIRGSVADAAGCQEPRDHQGGRASPDDVIGDVTPGAGLEEPTLPGASYGGRPAVDVQLGEDALGVGAQGVEGDVELAGDLGSGQVAVEEPQDVQLALAQRVRKRVVARRAGALWGAAGHGEEAAGLVPEDVGLAAVAVGGVVQQGEHRVALVEEEAHVAVRFGCLDERLVEGCEGVRPLPRRVKGEGSHHVDLDQAPGAARVGAGVEPVQQRERVEQWWGVLLLAVAGEQEPDQGEVVVLAQVRRFVGDADIVLACPLVGRCEVSLRDPDAGPHRGDGADVGVETGPEQPLGPVEQLRRGVEVPDGGAHLRHRDEPPVPVL